MIYKAIVGSQMYGLSAENSDIDLAIVSEKHFDKETFWKDGYDMRLWTPDELAVLRKGEHHKWFDFTRLFPYEFCIKNDLSNWIEENREEVVKAILPELYETYITDCVKLCQRADVLNKRTMLAIHFRNMLANYAEGMTFAEALKPQGVYRDFLLSIRNGKAPIARVQAANTNARERAKAVAGFYAEPKADLAILDEFKYMIYREVELLNS